MSSNGDTSETTSNTSSGYFDGSAHSGWAFDVFGDKITYSTNTLETAVDVTWPS